MTSLAWSTYVAASKPVVAEHLPPGETKEMWSPTSSTLIYGERDAVLVDALLTMNEGRALADWVAASGRNLTTIYITHGHGDHFFGASAILERFPAARMVATRASWTRCASRPMNSGLMVSGVTGSPTRSPSARRWPSRWPRTPSNSRANNWW